MLFTFPHGTGSLSVTREYLALGDGPPGFRRNFTCSAVLRIHSGENEVLTTGLLPPMAGLSRPLHLPRSFVTPYRVSYNPKRQASWFGLIPFRSPLLRGIAFAFSSSGYLDVSVPRVCLLISYEFRYGYHSITSGGFPHSEISGSKLAHSSRSISVFVPSFIGS